MASCRGVVEMHLAVIGRDEQRNVSGKHFEQSCDERVGHTQFLGEPSVEESEFVCDLVDSRVVRVDERGALVDLGAALFDECPDGAPSAERAVAEMGPREATVAVLRLGDDRNSPTGERWTALHDVRFRSAATATFGLPPQDVQHRVVDPCPVADDPVDSRRRAGRDR